MAHHQFLSAEYIVWCEWLDSKNYFCSVYQSPDTEIYYAYLHYFNPRHPWHHHTMLGHHILQDETTVTYHQANIIGAGPIFTFEKARQVCDDLYCEALIAE